jgi:hypothetical protein
MRNVALTVPRIVAGVLLAFMAGTRLAGEATSVKSPTAGGKAPSEAPAAASHRQPERCRCARHRRSHGDGPRLERAV